MNENLGTHLGNIEIADLIEESIANATQRRQQVIKDSLVDIPEEEAKNIQGGESSNFIPSSFPGGPLIVTGLIFPEEPITLLKI